MDNEMRKLRIDNKLYEEYKNRKVKIEIDGQRPLKAEGTLKNLLMLIYNLFSWSGKRGN